MFEHLKLFLQEVGLEQGVVEQKAGLRWQSMSTAAALKVRGESAVFMQNNGKPFRFYESAMLCGDISSN